MRKFLFFFLFLLFLVNNTNAGYVNVSNLDNGSCIYNELHDTTEYNFYFTGNPGDCSYINGYTFYFLDNGEYININELNTYSSCDTNYLTYYYNDFPYPPDFYLLVTCFDSVAVNYNPLNIYYYIPDETITISSIANQVGSGAIAESSNVLDGPIGYVIYFVIGISLLGVVVFSVKKWF